MVETLMRRLEAATFDVETGEPLDDDAMAYATVLTEAQAAIGAAEAENARLRGLMKPLAKQADEFADSWPDSMRPICGVPEDSPDDDDNATFTLGDLRAIRTALGGSHDQG